jgi:hypothetical protein
LGLGFTTLKASTKWQRPHGAIPKVRSSNSFNQAHDVKSLFITDGAEMVSSSCVNPSLTYMAVTARACDFAVQQMKKGEL